ncbi:MAG: DNA polymerase III subunit delta [Ruminococcus sp.]|nr:DNA polymerase III subunit delta [Ruminococcus sp.]
MPRTTVKGLTAALKKDGLSRVYYIFGADVTGVEKATSLVVKAALGENADIALTKLSGNALDMSELYDMVQTAPMMSDYNCILINDYNFEKPVDDMRGRTADSFNKPLLEAIKDIPEYTVVIFNVTGFEVPVKYDFKAGERVITDKNKKLADFVLKNGTVCEAELKTSVELSKLIADKVAARGGSISVDNAKELAEMCLCDELTIQGEIEKLCAYADGREITRDMLAELVHEQNDTTFYSLANAVAARNAKAAFEAVEQLHIDSDNRGAVLHAITSVFLDMYRAECGKRAGIPMDTASDDFKYGSRKFAMKNAYRDSGKFGLERLRACLVILRDTTMKLNSAPVDPRVAIEQAIVRMLSLRPQGRKR